MSTENLNENNAPMRPDAGSHSHASSTTANTLATLSENPLKSPDDQMSAVHGETNSQAAGHIQASGRAQKDPSRKPQNPRKGNGLSFTDRVGHAFKALQQAHEADRQVTQTRRKQEELSAQIEKDEKVYQHRKQIEADYDKIYTEQNAILDSCTKGIRDNQGVIVNIENRLGQLNQELAVMKAEHVANLKPYREVFESAQGRSEDTKRALEVTRKATQEAKTAFDNAKRARDRRMKEAHESIDNAEGRLKKLHQEYGNTHEKENIRAELDLREEISIEMHHLEEARSQLDRDQQEMKVEISNAQDHLNSQKSILQDAEFAYKNAQQEASAKKAELEAKEKLAREEERRLEDKISLEQGRIKALEDEIKNLKDKHADAEITLSEASEIKNTPEKTQAIKGAIADNRAAYQKQDEELTILQHRASKLKRDTKKERAALIVVLVAIVIFIIVCIWLAMKK